MKKTMTMRGRFGENLKKARRAAGLTQEDMADRTSLHRTEISLLERGGREPRLGTLLKLSGAIGIPPERLMAGISWNEEKQLFELKK